MICPICGKETPDEANYCIHCGIKIPKCPTCGTVLYTRCRFCVKDGTPIPESIQKLFPDEGSANQGNNGGKPGRFIIIVIVALLLLAVAALGAYLVFGSMNADHSEELIVESQTVSEPESETEEALSETITYVIVDKRDGTEQDAQSSVASAETEVETVQPSGNIPETTSDVEDKITKLIFACDSSYLTAQDLSGLDAFECRILRNGIYARHGRKFNDKTLQAYFDGCDWYTGTISADRFNENTLNKYEKTNAEFIKAYEESHGYL